MSPAVGNVHKCQQDISTVQHYAVYKSSQSTMLHACMHACMYACVQANMTHPECQDQQCRNNCIKEYGNDRVILTKASTKSYCGR